MDTKTFTRLSSEDYKRETQKNWGKDPCGSNYVDESFEKYSKDYFDEVERTRYIIQKWQPAEFETFDIKDKEVLEIGFGMGTDHLSMARRGGIMHGIDITEGNKTITEKRFAIYGYNTKLTVGDAEALPYSDNTFDFVYSFGVLHHTPDTQKAIDEVYRVLKPGGKCYIAVYNKNSLFFWWSVFIVDFICRLKFLKMSLQQRLSLIEYPNTNKDMVIRLYTKKDFVRLFSHFKNINTSINHLTKDCISGGKLLSEHFINRFIEKHATRIGWYVIVRAEK